MNTILSRIPLLLLFILALVYLAGCQPASPAVEPDRPGTPVGEEPVAPAPTPTPPPAAAADTPAPSGDLPPPPPLVLNGSQPQGTASIIGELIYDPDFLLRIDARRTSAPDEPGAGIARVEFRISSSTVADLYTFVDYSAPYCVFGDGDDACNPWPFVDGAYRWGKDGPPIEPGSYFGQAIFHYTPESGDGSGITEDFWTFTFEIAAP